MNSDRLAAIRSRIGAEPAGPWLDCIAMQFVYGYEWEICPGHTSCDCKELVRLRGVKLAVRVGDEFIYYDGDIVQVSRDHNACFAALAQLEKRGYEWMMMSKCGDEYPVKIRLVVPPDESIDEWDAGAASLSLAAARAIALAAVDNGVEVENA